MKPFCHGEAPIALVIEFSLQNQIPRKNTGCCHQGGTVVCDLTLSTWWTVFELSAVVSGWGDCPYTPQILVIHAIAPQQFCKEIGLVYWQPPVPENPRTYWYDIWYDVIANELLTTVGVPIQNGCIHPPHSVLVWLCMCAWVGTSVLQHAVLAARPRWNSEYNWSWSSEASRIYKIWLAYETIGNWKL